MIVNVQADGACCSPVDTINPELSKRLKVYKAWRTENVHNYSSAKDIRNAYIRLVKGQSPWPDGFIPKENTLDVGTQFKMALSPGQPLERPGGFGTFDDIPNVEYVRNKLAVKDEWKPEIDRVVTYEVIKPLPVLEGPVGPQADISAGKYLSGGGSQLEMTVSPRERMNHLRIVHFVELTE